MQRLIASLLDSDRIDNYLLAYAFIRNSPDRERFRARGKNGRVYGYRCHFEHRFNEALAIIEGRESKGLGGSLTGGWYLVCEDGGQLYIQPPLEDPEIIPYD